jgi:hypothetical protein
MLQWLQAKEELSRIASALERVASALERAVPPPPVGVDDLAPDQKDLYREIGVSDNLSTYRQEVEDEYHSALNRGKWVDSLQ